MSFPIRAKLLGAFALDLVLMILLGYVASQQMAVMNARANFVAEYTIPSLVSVAALKAHISEYRVNQLEYMLYTSNSDKARSLQRLQELEGRVDQTLDAYRPLISNEREGALLMGVKESWESLVAATHTSFIPDATLNNTGTVRPFYSRMNPLYSSLEQAIANLTTESQQQAAESLAIVQGAYATASGFIMFDTTLTIIISAVIGLVLSGRIALRLGRLTSAAGKVAAGDLDRRVEVVSRDELGQLADAFNRMVASLREKRRDLEERNAALQSVLAHQKQLTEDLLRGKRAEEEAHRAQAAAEAASQAKGMFLATMSHELRTPLNAILGYAQIMRLSGAYRASDGLDVDPLERIMVAGRHLTALINNVLDFSKIEQGKIELTVTRTPIDSIVREAADVVTPLTERQGNELRILCPHDIGTMSSDVGKVRQILINLLSNAAKFTECGVITLSATRAADATVVFTVSDTGIGIAPEHLERLFQPFSQIDASVTRRYEGTGLGLALSRQLCQALGGAIAVSSAPGLGSTFTVSLPVELAEREQPPDVAAYSPGAQKDVVLS